MRSTVVRARNDQRAIRGDGAAGVDESAAKTLERYLPLTERAMTGIDLDECGRRNSSLGRNRALVAVASRRGNGGVARFDGRPTAEVRYSVMEEVPAITLACARYRFDGVPVVAARRADSGKPGQRDRSHKTARDRRTVADPGNGYLASGFDRGDERTGRIEYDVVIGTVHLAVDPPPDASAAAVPRHLGWGSVRLPEAIVAPSAIAACG